MATYPLTGAAQSSAHVYGSCKLEVSTDSGVNWTNIGLARNVVFNETFEEADIQADNGPDITNYVADHNVEITWSSLELYIPTLNKIRGGIDTISVTSAVETTDTMVKTTGDWSRGVPYYFTYQGATDTLPSVANVKSVDTAGATDTLSSTKDYTTFTDTDNKSGIVVLTTAIAGGTTGLTTQSLRVNYVYGAIQARKMKTGGLSTISSRWFRLTNKQIVSGSAKYRYFVVYSGSLNAGLNLAFKSANEADAVLEIPMSIKAKLDSSRTEGDQLFYIEDQVGTA